MNGFIPAVVHKHTQNLQLTLEAASVHRRDARGPRNYTGVVPNIGSTEELSTAVVNRDRRRSRTRPHAYPQGGLLEHRSRITMGAGKRKGRA